MSDSLLDLDQLLAPISEDDPCGPSLRWEPIWSEIQQDRKIKSDPLGQSPDEPPNWRLVIEKTSDQLANHSKDLMLAVWLVDALVRAEGIHGFHTGLQFLAGLVETYWDSIHPQIEDGDPEQRLAPFLWLTDEAGGARLPTALRQAALLSSTGDDALSFLFWEGRRARPQQPNEDADAYARRCQEADRKREIFDKAAAGVSLSELADLQQELLDCERLVQSLDDQLTRLSGAMAPSWAAIESALADVRGLVRNLLKERGGAVDDAEESSETATNAAGSHAHGRNAGPAQSRAEAVMRLQEAATYFTAAEPHSPVGYLVRRAIRWANLPFEQLLAELLKEGQPLEQVRETLGINASSGSSE
jgi:type VI secretion system protein ImpA